MQSRTDAVQAAILRELDRNRAVMDANPDLFSVTVTVRLDPRRSAVRRVEFHQETARET